MTVRRASELALVASRAGVDAPRRAARAQPVTQPPEQVAEASWSVHYITDPLRAPPAPYPPAGRLPTEAEADGRKSSCRLSVPAKGDLR